MKHEIVSLSGEVDGFNISPHGEPESVLLRIDGGLVQVNLPGEPDADILAGLKPGTVAQIEAIPYDGEKGDHPVYEMLVRARHWSGKVVRINYALHGEPNGVVLETGEFVHLKPPKAKVAGLTLGEEVTVEGWSFTSEAGFTVVEPETLNGYPVDKLKKPKKKH